MEQGQHHSFRNIQLGVLSALIWNRTRKRLLDNDGGRAVYCSEVALGRRRDVAAGRGDVSSSLAGSIRVYAESVEDVPQRLQ